MLGILALGCSLAADVREIRPRTGSNWGRDEGKGEMNVRLDVDEEVEVEVRADRMFVRALTGRVARDAGSDLSASMPLRDVRVDFRKRSGRGRVWLVEQPSRANRFTLRMRIRDPQRGEGRYHIRLRYATDSWGWQDRRTAVPWGGNPATLRPSPAPVVAVSWREGAWGRPPSWRGELPGRALDPWRRQRVGDIQGRSGGRFEFRGRVDEEVLFFIRGNQVTAQTQFGRRMEVERWSLDEPFPLGRPLRLRLDRRDGRGEVSVLEEPNPRNNFTTVILVSDRRGGSDRYHFRLDWRR
jgi:hypothetical protein